MGGTTLALERRRRNAPLFRRVFRGRAIDVGGAPDPLRTDDAWPELRDVLVFDLPDDGHDLRRFAAQTFDLVYSSHTLEHMERPEDAVAEWARVTKVGGHMVIVVPDWELYEHREWPSLRNGDHKTRFTTDLYSYLGVVTVDRLLCWLPYNFRLVSALWLVEGFDTDEARLAYAMGQDLTALRLCECGIEIILERLS